MCLVGAVTAAPSGPPLESTLVTGRPPRARGSIVDPAWTPHVSEGYRAEREQAPTMHGVKRLTAEKRAAKRKADFMAEFRATTVGILKTRLGTLDALRSKPARRITSPPSS